MTGYEEILQLDPFGVPQPEKEKTIRVVGLDSIVLEHHRSTFGHGVHLAFRVLKRAMEMLIRPCLSHGGDLYGGEGYGEAGKDLRPPRVWTGWTRCGVAWRSSVLRTWCRLCPHIVRGPLPLTLGLTVQTATRCWRR